MTRNKIQILLLEDDPLDAELLKRAMQDTGLRVALEWVDCFAAAATAVSTKTFDVILSDLTLPDSFGIQTIERMHALAPAVPIVVLTSIDDRELALRLLEAGAQDYIPKEHVTGVVLDRAISHAIQRKEQLVETHKLLEEISQTRELLQSKNQKLEKLYKQAHDFVDNVSHEFRTPLTVIKEYASLMSEGCVGELSEQQVHMLKIVENRADDLNTMVDDMLDSSKLEAGLVGACRQPTCVSDILDNVTVAIERKAQVKGVTLDYQVAEDLPTIYCDAEKIGRVLTNLAVNALKFCGDPGVVRISVGPSDDGDDVIFSVHDDGHGIPQERVQQIFERFRQLGTTSRGSCKGFGLGLAIAKELVDLNFGQIDVTSSVGQGSTFSFSVPTFEPRQLVRKYLHYLRGATCPTKVVLLRTLSPEDRPSEYREAVEAVLNQILRRTDLLLPAADEEWLVALPIGQSDLHKFRARLRQAWEEANRNRPGGRLPELAVHCLGNWSIPQQSQLLEQAVVEQVVTEEAAYV